MEKCLVTFKLCSILWKASSIFNLPSTYLANSKKLQFWLFFFCDFSPNASELKSADLLLITVLLYNIFPHSKQAVPITLNRTPPPLAHQVLCKGGPSISHHILSSPSTNEGCAEQERHPKVGRVHSDPVDIRAPQRKAEPEDTAYAGSSVEDELFYSPRSSPIPSEGREATAQELTPKNPLTLKEHFFTPRADTPDYLKRKVS